MSSWTSAASAIRSHTVRAAPGHGYTWKRVPELPYPHDGRLDQQLPELGEDALVAHGAAVCARARAPDVNAAFAFAAFESESEGLDTFRATGVGSARRRGRTRRRAGRGAAMPNLSQDDRLQHVLRLLETRDSVGVTELSQLFSVSEVTVRGDLRLLARRGLAARVRGGVRALQHGQSELGFDLRLRLRDRAQAGDRARGGGDGRRGRGGRARLEHDRLLPRARAADEARARRRDERPADRGRARRRAGRHGPRHGRRPPPAGDVARRRRRAGGAAQDADQQGLRRARAGSASIEG